MELQEVFNRDGFAVLPQFYTDVEIDAAVAAVATCKKARPEGVVIDFTDIPNGGRASIAVLSEQEAFTRHFKINDLYLCTEAIRHLGMNERMAPILENLLGAKPVLCNSLNMDFGSAQPPHVDALYMTPQTPGHLIAIWIALEDAHPDAGQLEYFPGSHLIPQYIFSSGSPHFVPEEMDKWKEYISNEVQKAGLERLRFAAKKGDVLIWHAHLLHGGTPINDKARTRKSLVFHYYSESDCIGMGSKLAPLGGAFWMDRPAASIPDEQLKTLSFSESGYLARYADVAQAVAAGHFKSGKQHFDRHGRAEGRLPR